MTRSAFYISDRTGISAETLGHTLLTQFENVEFRRVNLPFVDSEEKARKAVKRINEAGQEDGTRPLVFSTLVDPELREIIARSDGLLLDFFDAFIDPLETELGVKSSHAVGRSHGMGVYAEYKMRIDAVNFALTNDDGMRTTHYPDSDIILIGVSRTGKTPTCLYLALQYGVFAANYPITEEDLDSPHLPASVVEHRDKLFGLTIDPARLQHIRGERRPDSRYASESQCRKEVQAVESLYRRENIAFLDTSSVSIEEIATTIMHRTGMVRRVGG